jgi:heptosyltransferase II
MKPKLLIIKLGWSETLDAEISRVSSLGDVLRTTVVLHHFRDHHITWLVDERALQLIENNPLIHRPLIFDLSSVLQLSSERFDVVVNFEKTPGLCAFADKIMAPRRYGFAFDPETGGAVSRDGCERVFDLVKNIDEKRTHREPWQQVLFEMVGGTWSGQEYILGYKPQSEVKFDFGLNHVVGSKWPTKNWSKNHWARLRSLLETRGFSVSWQEGLEDLNRYMEWIHSCKNIITCDSLGFHLALAMRKKVVVLFGPTNANETYLYERGISILPREFACAPCLSPICHNERFCMDNITPEEVLEAALQLATPARSIDPASIA